MVRVEGKESWVSRGRMSIVDSGGDRVRIGCTDTEMRIGFKGTVYE